MVCSFFLLSLLCFTLHVICQQAVPNWHGNSLLCGCFTPLSIITTAKIHIRPPPASVQQVTVPKEPISPNFINCSACSLALCAFKKCSIWFTTIPGIHYWNMVQNCHFCLMLHPTDQPHQWKFPSISYSLKCPPMLHLCHRKHSQRLHHNYQNPLICTLLQNHSQ